MAIVHVTKDNFDETVVKSGKKVLLDFWASWCGPCKMLSPILEEIAAEMPGVLVGKVNIDEEMDLAMKFQITSIPTLILWDQGKAVGQCVGYRPKADIVNFVNKG